MNSGDPNLDYNINFPPPPSFESPNCADTDPEIFFPVSARDVSEGHWPKEKPLNYRGKRPSGKAIKPIEVAKKLCMECPHMSPCREYAIVNRLQFGIWGGTTYRERLMLIKLIYNDVSEEEFDGEEAAG
jgi:WhiB family redox-sensing transcriptional regulator